MSTAILRKSLYFVLKSAFWAGCLTFLGTQVGAAPICPDLLRHQTIQDLREAPDFSDTHNGTYIFKDGQAYYTYRYSNDVLATMLGNTASHIDIIRRTLGAEKFSAILRAKNPRGAYDAEMSELAKRATEVQNLASAARLRSEIESIPDTIALSRELSWQVTNLLNLMGRLASPMTKWVDPKLQMGVLQQLSTFNLEITIQRFLKPTNFIYKAVMVKVLLDSPQTLILSAGKFGVPDTTHDAILKALELVIPKARILNTISGYILIEPDTGLLEFQTKDFEKTVLRREHL